MVTLSINITLMPTAGAFEEEWSSIPFLGVWEYKCGKVDHDNVTQRAIQMWQFKVELSVEQHLATYTPGFLEPAELENDIRQ